MQRIHETLSHVQLDEAVCFKNLSMTPLMALSHQDPDYHTLDEALARGDIRLTETSEAGAVPELRLVNRGEWAVLLLDGEELVGAKQNRVLNLTILAPAQTTMHIPVSCVEAGRWSPTSPEFSTKGRAFYAAGRARKAGQVTESLRVSGTRHSRQGEVWADIADKSRRMQSFSDTAAMARIYDDYHDQVDEYVAAMAPAENQVGAAFAINGRIRGLDLFDCAPTLRKLLPKIVRSYALDAIDEQMGTVTNEIPGVDRFLQALRAAETFVHPALGEGDDVRIVGTSLAGGALWARNRLMHLCAFQLYTPGSNKEKPDGRLARSTRRARHYGSTGGNGPDIVY